MYIRVKYGVRSTVMNKNMAAFIHGNKDVRTYGTEATLIISGSILYHRRPISQAKQLAGPSSVLFRVGRSCWDVRVGVARWKILLTFLRNNPLVFCANLEILPLLNRSCR